MFVLDVKRSDAKSKNVTNKGKIADNFIDEKWKETIILFS